MKISFETISSEEFEYLCEQLLEKKGFTITSRPARGPDQGRDLLVERYIVDDMGVRNREIWLIECKHFANSGKSVKENDIGNFDLKMRQHGANRYLLVTTTTVSETVKNQLQALSNDNSSNRKAIFWNRHDLDRFAEEYQTVFSRYFPWVNQANIICEHIRNDHRLFSIHRGSMPWGDNITVMYGNDGYDPEPGEPINMYNTRTRMQVKLIEDKLKDIGLKQLAFGKSRDGATWVILVESTDIARLNAIVWEAFLSAMQYVADKKC